MSETTYNYFKGIAKVAQTKKPNAYGAYTCCLQFDDENEIDKYRKSGIQAQMDEENKVWFRRPHQKLIKQNLETFGPPRVVNVAGEDIDDMIGTDSKVIVKVRSYPTMKGIGHTLDAIQVLELVKVELNRDDFHNF